MPLAYVPPYLGNVREAILSGNAFKGEEAKELTEEEKNDNLNRVADLMKLPVSQSGVPYMWNMNAKLSSDFPLENVHSNSHSIEVTYSEDRKQAQVALKEDALGKAFELSYKEATGGKPNL